MQVIYDDNHLVIVDKPGDMVTQPNLVDEVKAWLKTKHNKPGNVFCEPIHRLDRPVSGLLIMARTSKALSRLQAAMRNREIHKWYHAQVEQEPNEPTATLEHYLTRGNHRALVVSPSHAKAKYCLLTYTCLGPKLLEIELHTGRYHQIRAQLAAIGCPIVGDIKYGASRASRTIGLRHVRCILPHPTQNKKLTINLSLPGRCLAIPELSVRETQR